MGAKELQRVFQPHDSKTSNFLGELSPSNFDLEHFKVKVWWSDVHIKILGIARVSSEVHLPIRLSPQKMLRFQWSNMGRFLWCCGRICDPTEKGAAKPLPAVAKVVGGAPCTSGSLFFYWRDGFSAGNNHGLTETFLSNCPFIHFYPFLPLTFRIVGQRLRAKCSTLTGTRPRFWSNWRTQLNGDSKQLPTGNS